MLYHQGLSPLILLLLLTLATIICPEAAATATVQPPPQGHISFLKAAMINYYSSPSAFQHSRTVFEAKDYKLYIDRSAPVLARRVTTMQTRTDVDSTTDDIHLHSSAPTDFLVSGPALSFIVVLTLGAFMF